MQTRVEKNSPAVVDCVAELIDLFRRADEDRGGLLFQNFVAIAANAADSQTFPLWELLRETGGLCSELTKFFEGRELSEVALASLEVLREQDEGASGLATYLAAAKKTYSRIATA